MKNENRLREDTIMRFLREDLGQGDITSEALVEEGQEAKATLYFREEGVTAGLEEAAIVFRLLGCSVKPLVPDGVRVPVEKPLLEVEGPARALLGGERTALNIVSRMAGIATTVAQARRIAADVDPDVRVAATRKTAPGLRVLDKKAVVLGGGDTHRFRLDDCVLIKDNHLELVPSISEAIARARKGVSFTKKIEVEVTSIDGAAEAAEAGADIIMLDNMSPNEIKGYLGDLEARGLREGRLFEASGGITLENLADYARSGVDVISMGCLTHSVRSLNVKLKIEMV